MRRRDDIVTRQIDRRYPNQVEIRIPDGGLGSAIERMFAFCEHTDYQTRDVGKVRRLEIGGEAMRWCFATLERAEAFRARFGGERLPPLMR